MTIELTKDYIIAVHGRFSEADDLQFHGTNSTTWDLHIDEDVWFKVALF